MNYVRVENGQITEGPMNLPKNWRNVSGLNMLPDIDLLDLGWYPVEYIEIAYDTSAQYHDGYLVDIQPEKVVLTSKIGDFTRYQLEVNAVNDYMADWERLDEEMDRDEEDHITFYHGGIPDDTNRGTRRTQKVIYDERIAKRANPPADPVPPQPGEPDYVEPSP